ncbi:MuDR family transposase [Corchorus olitorius]|uniref:MuDR family transposase n=1 Tax=Corchorus olitorius TaxID=93759 RepID=A0A1R3KYW1_9ROSI|nr:MuDR family transposase [Corchorus olitorius]
MGKKEKDITILCYWNGNIVEGLEGLCYDQPPNKAVKVKLGLNYELLLNKMYSITSLDRQQFRIKMTCRYPSVVGPNLKYIVIPVRDDDDVDIMFDALTKHDELSNIDLYLETEILSSDIRYASNQDEDDINEKLDFGNMLDEEEDEKIALVVMILLN